MQDRGELKVMTVSRKMTNCSIQHREVRTLVEAFGLGPLMLSFYQEVDKSILLAFV